MKYLEPSFSTLPPAGAAYRDNHDRIFGKKAEQPLPEDAHLKDESAEDTGSCVSPSFLEAQAGAKPRPRAPRQTPWHEGHNGGDPHFDARVAVVEAKVSAGYEDEPAQVLLTRTRVLTDGERSLLDRTDVVACKARAGMYEDPVSKVYDIAATETLIKACLALRKSRGITTWTWELLDEALAAFGH